MDTKVQNFLTQWQAQQPPITIQTILCTPSVQLDMLRLDLVHPYISGNKWFKLKYNLLEAVKQHKQTILSLGGAYSNHLHALAYAGHLFGFKTVGIVRGEPIDNPTLNDCKQWGMQLHFLSRSNYQLRHELDFNQQLQQDFPEAFFIPEGANNRFGIDGCAEILTEKQYSDYNYISTSVGTGATMEGLLRNAPESMTILGFSALKKCDDVQTHLSSLVEKNFKLFPDVYFGGFAKASSTLFAFQQNFQAQYQIELDRVYTAKMMYQLLDQIEQGFFPNGSKILAIHTGGLQGNRSLSI